MKKVMLLSVMVMFLFSCSNKSKVEKNVKEYLRQNLSNFSSYDPVEFGDLQINYTHYPDTPEGDSLFKKMNSYKFDIDDLNNMRYDYVEWHKYTNKQINDSIKKMTIKYESIKNIFNYKDQHFKEIPNGYWISHKFRCADKGGDMDIRYYHFILDDDFNVLKME